MELKDFIKTAVVDITNAISELQEELQNGSIINPTLPYPVTNKAIRVNNIIRPIETLVFDIAVTATETSGIEGGAKAGISVFGAKVGAATNAKAENVSKLTFSIPVILPSVNV